MTSISKLAPHVQKYVEKLKQTSEGKNIAISGAMKTKQSYSHCNRFIMKIPYCTRVITVEVRFTLENPKRMPEIITTTFVPNILKIESFKVFDWLNPSSFSNCIIDMIKAFRETQKKLIKTVSFGHVQLDYEMIQSKKGVEYFVSDDKLSVVFKIPLTIPNMEDFIEVLNLKDLPEDYSPFFLLASYNVNNHLPSTRLEFSKDVDHLEYLKNIKLPVWKFGQTCLFDYISDTERNVGRVIEKNVTNVSRRKNFMLELKKRLSNPLEIDTEKWLTSCFLVNHAGFCFYLHFTVSEEFPFEAPLIQIQSLSLISKQENDGTIFPMRARMTKFKYDPREMVEVMVERILKRCIQVAKQFEEICKEYVKKKKVVL